LLKQSTLVIFLTTGKKTSSTVKFRPSRRNSTYKTDRPTIFFLSFFWIC